MSFIIKIKGAFYSFSDFQLDTLYSINDLGSLISKIYEEPDFKDFSLFNISGKMVVMNNRHGDAIPENEIYPLDLPGEFQGEKKDVIRLINILNCCKNMIDVMWCL